MSPILTMSCYFPLNAFKAKSNDASKIAVVFSRPLSWKGEPLRLPCGQCTGCRLERSRQWAIRCVHEASLYDKNCFITLTYDDSNLPVNGSLDLRHYQLFMKRLRKQYGSGIRFYHCGEYGEKFKRPHYHALLFNHDFGDKVHFKGSGELAVSTSESLSKLWPYGFAVVGQVSFESAAYVARYVMKKINGDKADAFYGGRKPEYSTMSRRPGIGSKWFEKYVGDVYPADRVVVSGRISRPPRFYDKLFSKRDPSTMAFLKIAREGNERFVNDVVNGKIIRESDSTDRRLLVKNEVKLAEISTLRRSLHEA